jgi:uncharacterized ferritin-like protein (DUF455 family)
MQALSAAEITVTCGIPVRKGPAREACFNVVAENTELVVQADPSVEPGKDMCESNRRNKLHTHMHNEMQSIEIAAQCLVDFPDADWELRMELARQCWDESRHARLLYRRLVEIGGRKGEFPVMHFEWSITGMQDSLAARLAIQNRTFEGGEIDILKQHSQMWRDEGDEVTAELVEGILSDEIQHVRFANVWLKRLAKKNPGTLLEVLRGLGFMKKVIAAYAPSAGEVNAAGARIEGTQLVSPTNVDDRRLAEFSEQEIADLLRRDGFGALVPQSR